MGRDEEEGRRGSSWPVAFSFSVKYEARFPAERVGVGGLVGGLRKDEEVKKNCCGE